MNNLQKKLATREHGMSVKDFDKLKKRDFENGAVLDEIAKSLKERERLLGLCLELDVEMDGVSPIPQTAAAILNGIRAIVKEYH